MSVRTTTSRHHNATTDPAVPHRSMAINLLGGYMLLQGAFGMLLTLGGAALLAQGGSTGADGAPDRMPLAIAALALLPLCSLLVGVGLLQRRRWSLYLLVLLWGLSAVSDLLRALVGVTMLPQLMSPGGGGSGAVGVLVIVLAVRLLLLYWLTSHADEFR